MAGGTVRLRSSRQRGLQMYFQGGCANLKAEGPFWLLLRCVSAWWYPAPCSPEGLACPHTMKSCGNANFSLVQTCSLHWRQLFSQSLPTHAWMCLGHAWLLLLICPHCWSYTPREIWFSAVCPPPPAHMIDMEMVKQTPHAGAHWDVCAPIPVTLLLWEET